MCSWIVVCLLSVFILNVWNVGCWHDSKTRTWKALSNAARETQVVDMIVTPVQRMRTDRANVYEITELYSTRTDSSYMFRTEGAIERAARWGARRRRRDLSTWIVIRPIPLLTLSLLTLLDSNFLVSSLWTWEFHPFKFNIMLESNPLKPTMLVGRLGVLA